MSFVHDDSDFADLIRIVAADTGIAAALVEKDYWVTHTLWALHQTGLDIWFKGGTSLSKGFGLIQRFSEDLDLMVERGAVASLPAVTSWTSTNRGPVASRAAFYDSLTAVLDVPGVRVERDGGRVDPRARAADYLGHYPGTLLGELSPSMSPFVRLEIGRARVVPLVERDLDSFVHQHLAQRGMAANYTDTRPTAVRCVHPMVTLLEKLDAMARRYRRDVIEPAGFVRHYEDAAQIIRAEASLPETGVGTNELVADMVAQRDIAARPTADEPALLLADPAKRELIEEAYEQIAPMYWGPRISLDEACATIRSWVGRFD